MSEIVTKIDVSTISQDDWDLSFKYPAATGRGRFYLIQKDAIVGQMRMVSGVGFAGSSNSLYSHVTVEPDDESAKRFFADDYAMETLGFVANLRYDGITGCPVQGFTDEPDNRHKDTVIVDSLEFDFGIAHPRFSDVSGWGQARKKNTARIRTQHPHRRPRSSTKIKKMMHIG
jgi:hypothetical protein